MTSQDILQRLQLCLPRLAPNLRPNAQLRDLGLDSMDHVELLCVIHEEFGVRLTESEFQPQLSLDHILAQVASKAKPKLANLSLSSS
ncbi:MAG TPA: acyl carrier protein [Prosthecobacter sp.]|nr:acyl carrier protein [Prosthecobacter sp.]